MTSTEVTTPQFWLDLVAEVSNYLGGEPVLSEPPPGSERRHRRWQWEWSHDGTPLMQIVVHQQYPLNSNMDKWTMTAGSRTSTGDYILFDVGEGMPSLEKCRLVLALVGMLPAELVSG